MIKSLLTKRSLVAFTLVPCALMAGTPAASVETPTSWTRVTQILAGDSFFRIQTNAAIINPDGCADPDGYIVPYSHPASEKFLSIALSAQATRQDLQITINGCHLARPQIVAMNVRAL